MNLPVTKSGTGDTSLYRFLTKGQQWLWIKTRGVVKYQEGTKHPTSVICHNIVASYAEVWQYLQNKSRQYGPKERQLGPAPPPDVARTVAASTKTEQTSPGGGLSLNSILKILFNCVIILLYIISRHIYMSANLLFFYYGRNTFITGERFDIFSKLFWQ